MLAEFITYIENLPISNNYKKLILNPDFQSSNPVYYQHYPELFANHFSIDKDVLKMLNIAGYLYYQATLFADQLVDEGNISKFPLITICQEESIKILTNIFGLENDFWKLWNVNRNEYFEAIYLEKSFLEKDDISIQEFEILADKKSAFGKVAIDCLISISKDEEETYKKLILSHQYFSVAFQLNDDIQDLKSDKIKGQFNWAVYLLKKQNISDYQPHILEKYMHLRGISKEMYKLGISYCDKALKIIEDVDVPKWKKVLEDTKKAFVTFIIEIDNYLEILNADIKLVNQRIVKNDLRKSIKSSIEFIKKGQNEDGSFREYINQGGISTTWATAFILSKISDNGSLKSSFSEEISRAISFLKNNKIEALWSYNTTWIEDADSSNFVFLSYSLNDINIEKKFFEEWLLFQKSDGGFSTYKDKNELLTALNDKYINDVSGWIYSHDCVSAVSFYYLATTNQRSDAFIKIKNYFELKINVGLNSYWWTSDIYILYYLAKTYYLLNDKEQLSFILNKIKKNQKDNGSFEDKYGENLFYTGLAVEILLLDDNKDHSQIKKSIEYILEKQYIDGSWDNSNALQVPNSSMLNPNENFFLVATFGMNVRAKEFNRLFTTSAILQTLFTYEQIYSSSAF